MEEVNHFLYWSRLNRLLHIAPEKRRIDTLQPLQAAVTFLPEIIAMTTSQTISAAVGASQRLVDTEIKSK